MIYRNSWESHPIHPQYLQHPLLGDLTLSTPIPSQIADLVITACRSGIDGSGRPQALNTLSLWKCCTAACQIGKSHTPWSSNMAVLTSIIQR